MTEARQEPSSQQDHNLEVAMGNMLRMGVLLAAAVVLLGGILYLRHAGAPVPDYHTFHATGGNQRSIVSVLRDLPSLQSRSIIQFGILLLIATPVARVVFALFGFAVERDWMYTVVSGIVLAVLLFSLIHSQ